MDQILTRIVNNGLADFKGLHIQGTVPIPEELANELITQFIKSVATPADPAILAAADPPTFILNPQELLQHLDIQALRVSFEPGVAKLTVDVRR